MINIDTTDMHIKISLCIESYTSILKNTLTRNCIKNAVISTRMWLHFVPADNTGTSDG